nr:DsbA family protein [Paenactinomyces guangxiensis]
MATVILAAIGLGFFALFQPGSDGKNDSANQATVQKISYEGQPGTGNPNAPVKLMEFGDFKCPACKYFHDEIYPQLKKDYIDTGKVQMFFTNYQFIGEDSVTAGMAGEAVYHQNKDAFWKFYEAIYTHQGNEADVWATPEFLTELVKKNVPNIDINKLSQDLNNKTYEKAVLEDNQMARSLKIEGVPALFINGKNVGEISGYEELKKMIDEELKKK